MDKVKKSRSIQRASFTRLLNNLEEELNKAERNLDEIQVTFQQLDKKNNELLTSNETIVNFMLEDSNCPESEIISETEKAESYHKKFLRIQLTVNRILVKRSSSESVHSSFVNNKCKYKLPKIEWNKYGGEPLGWISFWNQFKKIHNDETMEDSDKYQYLVQATLEGSRAREVVDSYPPSGENYSKVIESLKRRFGRDDVLVEVYVRELLKLVLSNAVNQDKVTFSTLYNKLESHLRALETLGVTQDKYAAMLYPLVESSLPVDLLRAWQRSSYWSTPSYRSFLNHSIDTDSTQSTKSRLELLMTFLGREVEGEERIELAMTGFGLDRERSSNVVKKPIQHKLSTGSVSTAAVLFSAKPEEPKQKCAFCEGAHPSKDCFEAKKLDLSVRIDRLKAKGHCFRCLKRGHRANKCRMSLCCSLCQRRHDPLTCPLSCSSRNGKIEDNLDKTKSLTMVANPNYCDDVTLQTLVVLVKGPSGERYVRGIIDTGSMRSYIRSSCASQLGLIQLKDVPIKHTLFGGVTTTERSHSCFEVNVTSLDGTQSRDIEVLDQPTICSYVSPVNKGLWSKELEELNIRVTDCGKVKGDIEILFGADVAGHIMTDRIHRLKCGLTAVDTIFGWTLLGKTNDIQEKSSVSYPALTSTSMMNISIPDLWKLDLLGIEDPYSGKNRKDLDEATLKHFEDTVRVNFEGRYEISLPRTDSREYYKQ